MRPWRGRAPARPPTNHPPPKREALVGAGTTFWWQGFEPETLGGIDAAVALFGHAPAWQCHQIQPRRRYLCLKVERAGSDGQLRVDDSGGCTAAQDQPRLFEPVDRVSQAHSGIEGAGMGRAIRRALLGLTRGRFEVVSTVGVGSRFSAFLPAAGVQSTSLPT